MALSPLYRLLATIAGLRDTPVESLPPDEARRQFTPGARGPALVMGRPAALASVVDTVIAGVPVRRYVPRAPKPGLIVFFHGGGWVVGDLDSHHIPASHLAAAAGRELVAVHYRRAPEFPFPAAFDDALAVTRHFHDASAGVVVAGDSAGGNLAAAVALELPVQGQLLVYPGTDLAAEAPSYERYATGHVLRRDAVRYYRQAYAPEAAMREDPRCSVLRAPRVPHRVPAYVLLAENDVLHDEGVAYARKLEAAGTPTVLDVVPGVFHGFFNMQALAAGRESLRRAARWLEGCLSEAGSSAR